MRIEDQLTERELVSVLTVELAKVQSRIEDIERQALELVPLKRRRNFLSDRIETIHQGQMDFGQTFDHRIEPTDWHNDSDMLPHT